MTQFDFDNPGDDIHPHPSYYLPTWWEIRTWQQETDENDDPTEKAVYYSQFGIRALDLSPYTHLVAKSSDIYDYFDDRFANRMINSETLEQWQVRLQRHLRRVGGFYDRSMELYAANATAISDVKMDQKTTYNNLTDSGKSADTPDTATDWPAGYADRRDENIRSGSVDIESTGPGGEITNVNANLDAWRDIIADFVDAFAPCFLNILD